MTEFFTADEHYGTNMPGRPFEDENEAEITMIYNYNKVVTPEDSVCHIGDFCHFREDRYQYYENLLKRLNGKKHLILGNHDKCDPFFYVEMGFTTVHTALDTFIEGTEIVMAHDPSVHCLLKKQVLISGHIHTLFRKLVGSRAFNVGVDVNYFTPVSIHTILIDLKLVPSDYRIIPNEAHYVSTLDGKNNGS